ncbi:hypothetical protein ADUPG1_014152, partial [Aduncisulcus paluster]
MEISTILNHAEELPTVITREILLLVCELNLEMSSLLPIFFQILKSSHLRTLRRLACITIITVAGARGIHLLLDVTADEDDITHQYSDDLSSFILSFLANLSPIVNNVVVPTLIEASLSSHAQTAQHAADALSRLGEEAAAIVLPFIPALCSHPSITPLQTALILRSAGKCGEKVLLNWMREGEDEGSKRDDRRRKRSRLSSSHDGVSALPGRSLKATPSVANLLRSSASKSPNQLYSTHLQQKKDMERGKKVSIAAMMATKHSNVSFVPGSTPIIKSHPSSASLVRTSTPLSSSKKSKSLHPFTHIHPASGPLQIGTPRDGIHGGVSSATTASITGGSNSRYSFGSGRIMPASPSVEPSMSYIGDPQSPPRSLDVNFEEFVPVDDSNHSFHRACLFALASSPLDMIKRKIPIHVMPSSRATRQYSISHAPFVSAKVIKRRLVLDTLDKAVQSCVEHVSNLNYELEQCRSTLSSYPSMLASSIAQPSTQPIGSPVFLEEPGNTNSDGDTRAGSNEYGKKWWCASYIVRGDVNLNGRIDDGTSLKLKRMSGATSSLSTSQSTSLSMSHSQSTATSARCAFLSTSASLLTHSPLVLPDVNSESELRHKLHIKPNGELRKAAVYCSAIPTSTQEERGRMVGDMTSSASSSSFSKVEIGHPEQHSKSGSHVRHPLAFSSSATSISGTSLNSSGSFVASLKASGHDITSTSTIGLPETSRTLQPIPSSSLSLSTPCAVIISCDYLMLDGRSITSAIRQCISIFSSEKVSNELDLCMRTYANRERQRIDDEEKELKFLKEFQPQRDSSDSTSDHDDIVTDDATK